MSSFVLLFVEMCCVYLLIVISVVFVDAEAETDRLTAPHDKCWRGEAICKANYRANGRRAPFAALRSVLPNPP